MKNHEQAQVYELESHTNWLLQDSNYKTYLKNIKKTRKKGIAEPHYLDMFFKNDIAVFNEFVKNVKDKKCLEVAGGILGVMPLWSNWINGDKISIDPLLHQCNDWLEKQGESWFQNITLHSKCAEETIPELVNTIDGFILWRNGLDHMEDPALGLKVVSSYAKRGCMFLFWSDVKHHDTPDDGHKNIADTPEEVEKMIIDCGWEIQYRTPNIHEHLQMVEYGCLAIKK